MPPETIRVGRRDLEITHPDKALFDRPRVTKLDLARHYERVGEAMLPHVRGRPVALEAFPRGIEGGGYYMKSVPKHFPDWIETAKVAKRGGSLTQVVAENAATLVYLAAQNVITPHIWLSRIDEPRKPDRLIIDLDPNPGIGFAAVRAAARDAGDRLRDAGLVPFAMVTGSRGVHVVCPLRRGPDYKAVHTYARSIADAMVADDPKRSDARVAPGRARAADLRRRQPDQLRPARGRSLRGAGAAASPGGDADRVGRALRSEAEAGSLDRPQRRRAARVGG